LLVIFPFAFAIGAAAEEESAYDPDLKYAQVREVVMEREAEERWTFHVRVRHADSGWDHYADLWQVLDAETGEVLGERPLAHPHTNEQPFTRSLRGVEIPASVETVLVRAKCTLHGYHGQQVRIPLDQPEGRHYSIRR
jgi:hypothetical protein